MAEKQSSPGRKPLNEKSLNSHQGHNATDTSSSVSSRRWRFLPLSSSARKRILESEDLANEARAKLVLVLMPASDTSLTCFLTQVCGGPLESVSQTHWDSRPAVLLEFVDTRHAKRFQDYVRAGNCTLNGRKVSILEPPQKVLSKLADRMKQNQVAKPRTSLPEIARRSLQLYTPITISVNLDSRPPPTTRSQVDIRLLMDMFGKLGHVLQVRPMFYQQSMAFAVDYDCIAAAVNAKTHFDSEKAALRAGGFTEEGYFSMLEGVWFIEYSRDPTEKACLM